MKGPEFINVRLALVGALVLTAATGVMARTQRIGVEQEGIIQTVKCPHPQVLDRDVKVVLARFPTSKAPDRPDVDFSRINDFFKQLLDKNPDGYQIDVITPFKASPKPARAGVLSVSSEESQEVLFNYVRKVKGIKSFRARISKIGVEVLAEEVPAPGRVDSFIESFFDKNGCEKDHILVDLASPYRLHVERVHSLKEFGLDGERKPVSAK